MGFYVIWSTTRWQLFGNQKLVSMVFFHDGELAFWKYPCLLLFFTPLRFMSIVYPPACHFCHSRLLVFLFIKSPEETDELSSDLSVCPPAHESCMCLLEFMSVHVLCAYLKNHESVCLSVWLPAKCLVRLPLSAALQNKSIFLVSSLSSRNFPPNA